MKPRERGEMPDFHGQWLQVPGYSLYFVSPCGAVCSWAKGYPLVMRPGISKKGYRSVRMKGDDGRTRTHYVHRLVLTCVRGAPPLKNEGAHLDGHPENNRFTNLEWTTRKVNHSHKKIHGTGTVGERHPMARLNEDDVRKLRAAKAAGATLAQLVEQSPVSRMTVFRAITGRSWSHIK